MAYENLGLRPKELVGKNYPEMADVLFSRVTALQHQIGALIDTELKAAFAAQCEAEHTRRQAVWDTDWLALNDGKRFFRDLHQTYGVRVSPIKLKKMIVERMQREQTDAWVLVERLIIEGLRIA